MITIEKILFLKRISIFNSLSSYELRMIAEVLTEEEFVAGEILFYEGQEGDCMYLVMNGKISIYTGTPPKIKTLKIFERGDFFGEMGLYDDKPRSASALAKEASCVLVLRKSDFCELIAEYPQVALGIMKELNQRLRETNLKLNSFDGRIIEKSSQIYTREYFLDCMANEFLKAQKENLALAFLVVLFDSLQPADPSASLQPYLEEQLVSDVGRILTVHQRPTDLCARLNNNRLCTMLTDADRHGAEAFLRRIERDLSRHMSIFQEAHAVVTEFSFSIKTFPEDSSDRDSMVSLLDQC